MKKLNKFWLMLPIVGALMVSCESFLEEENPSGVNSQTFYVTEKGAEAGVSSCYTFMREFFGHEAGCAFLELGTDIFMQGQSCAEKEFDNYNASLASTSTHITNNWKLFYLALNTCNEMIDKLPQSALSESVKKTRLGEVRFLRALYLWLIVETWGDVVLSTTPTTAVSTEAHRSSVDDFYKVIFEDLAYARENLPVTTPDYGRVTKGAADAFSARMYLTRKDYKNALECANAVLSNSQYKLEEDYATLWDMATCNDTTESIFVVNYASPANNNYNQTIIEGPDGNNMGHRDGGNHTHMLYTMLYDKTINAKGEAPVARDIIYGRPFARYMPTMFLLDLFNEEIDSRYHKSFRTEWLATKNIGEYKIGDLGIHVSKHEMSDAEREALAPAIVIDRSDVYNADGSYVQNRSYISLKKFEDPTREKVNTYYSHRDHIIIRLAEVYLIAAEAQMYLNNKAAAADLINEVRRRAAVDGKEKDMEISAADVTLDFILDERAREFSGECLRWMDLKRTGKLLERVKLHNPCAKPNIKEHHLVRPIPQTMLDAVTNKDEFQQNPGY